MDWWGCDIKTGLSDWYPGSWWSTKRNITLVYVLCWCWEFNRVCCVKLCNNWSRQTQEGWLPYLNKENDITGCKSLVFLSQEIIMCYLDSTYILKLIINLQLHAICTYKKVQEILAYNLNTLHPGSYHLWCIRCYRKR